MQDLIMTDQIGGVEKAGPDNDGPNRRSKKSGPDNDGPNDVTFGMENYNGLTTRR